MNNNHQILQQNPASIEGQSAYDQRLGVSQASQPNVEEMDERDIRADRRHASSGHFLSSIDKFNDAGNQGK